MDKRIFKHARKFHKWLGYLLALQIFAWLLGGLIMSAIPLEKVNVDDVENTSIFSFVLLARFAYSSFIVPVSFLVKYLL